MGIDIELRKVWEWLFQQWQRGGQLCASAVNVMSGIGEFFFC